MLKNLRKSVDKQMPLRHLLTLALLLMILAAGAWQLSAAGPGVAQTGADPCAQAPTS